MRIEKMMKSKKISGFLLVCLLSWQPFYGNAQDKFLTIFHTNDVHSCIYPFSPNLADTLLAGRGGFIRCYELMRQERQKDKDLLVFDTGDFSQGSPYYTLFKGDVEIGLMNMIGYDAITIGNHEMDYGLENMARIFKEAEFPVVCANYDFTGTVCEGLVKPYVILKKKGIKIGVFGLSPELRGLVSEKNCVGVKFLDPVKVAKETADLLKNKLKCDFVICLSHVGWIERGLGDQLIISKSRNIDLVLEGHSHTYFKTLRYVNNLDGVPVPVDQNGKNGVFVGKMTAKFRKAKK